MEGILTWNSLEYQRPATARMDCSSNGFGRCESMVQFAHLALVAWHMFFFVWVVKRCFVFYRNIMINCISFMLCMKHVLLHTNMQLVSVCEYKPIWCNFAYFQYCIPPRNVSSPVEQLSWKTTNRRLGMTYFECVSKRASVLLFVVAVGQSKGNWRQTRRSLSKVYSRDGVWRICDLLHRYKSFQCPTMLR